MKRIRKWAQKKVEEDTPRYPKYLERKKKPWLFLAGTSLLSVASGIEAYEVEAGVQLNESEIEAHYHSMTHYEHMVNLNQLQLNHGFVNLGIALEIGGKVIKPVSVLIVNESSGDMNIVPLSPQVFSNIKNQFNELASTKAYSEDEITPFIDYLSDLFSELIDTLLDPEKLAPILTEVAIVSPGIYLCWQLIKKISSFGQKNKNNLANQIVVKCSKILRYFEEVPKSRVEEISTSTEISVDEAELLLKLMCFLHEENCFWRPPLSKKDEVISGENKPKDSNKREKQTENKKKRRKKKRKRKK